MIATFTVFLLAFYAGAALMTGFAWLSAWRGVIGFSALRDLTGIADRAVLRRFFGLADPKGRYRVTLGAVTRHRRRSGVILSDLPVHLLFAATLAWAYWNPGVSSAAVAFVATLHAAIVAGAALTVVAGSRQAILP